MLTNRSPYWVRAMAELEDDDPARAVTSSHITSEFLEATIPCDVPSYASCVDCAEERDPFSQTPAPPSGPPNTGSTSRTGRPRWGEHIDSKWWLAQDHDKRWISQWDCDCDYTDPKSFK